MEQIGKIKKAPTIAAWGSDAIVEQQKAVRAEGKDRKGVGWQANQRLPVSPGPWLHASRRRRITWI